MASIHKEELIKAKSAAIWKAMCDVGNVSQFFPGVLQASHAEGNSRTVTFANGAVVRELIINIDHTARRFVYAAVEGGVTTHHNASWQLFDDASGNTRFVWISDFLPDEVAGTVGQLVDAGTAAFKRTLEGHK